MNITDLMPELKKNKLEGILKDKYEADYKQKNLLTQIAIQGKKYELETEQYISLMQILKKTNTKLEEIKDYAENHKEDKYFGIQIENQSIAKIQIINYQLTTLPAEIEQLTKLKEIYLWKNQLKTIPAEIGQLTELQKIDLWNNQLITLPKEIGRLTQLQYLDLEDNDINILPEEIGNLSNLQHLDLNNNNLTALPKSMGYLAQLRVLDLRNNNNLSALPKDIGMFGMIVRSGAEL